MPAPIDDPSEATGTHLVWDWTWIQLHDWGIVLVLAIAFVIVLVTGIRLIRNEERKADDL